MRRDAAREIITLIDGIECEMRHLEARLMDIRYRVGRMVLGPNAPQTKAAKEGKPNDDGSPESSLQL